MIEKLDDVVLENVTGGQIIAADGKYSNGSPGEKYVYLGTCRNCKKKWWSTTTNETCSCGGRFIWATHK